jgi:hypothetical protein
LKPCRLNSCRPITVEWTFSSGPTATLRRREAPRERRDGPVRRQDQGWGNRSSQGDSAGIAERRFDRRTDTDDELLSPTLSKMQKCPLPERARAECTKDPRVAPESSSRGFANSEAVPSRSFGLAAEPPQYSSRNERGSLGLSLGPQARFPRMPG